MILDLEPDDDLDNQDNPNQSDLIEQAAEMLYGKFSDSFAMDLKFDLLSVILSRPYSCSIHFDKQWYRTNVGKISKW